jgi:hypothetical protein
MKNYMVNGAGKDITPKTGTFFQTLDEAIAAWKEAGSPTQRGSSVWVTEMDASYETIRTITIG